MNRTIILLIAATLCGCTAQNPKGTEMSYKKYNEISKVEKINFRNTGIISKPLTLSIVDSFLIAHDVYSPKRGIYVSSI